MDGCPRQHSKKAYKAYDETGTKVMKIPARPPDLNPIENFFHLAKKAIKQQAINRNIQKESFEEFTNRVEKFVVDYPVDTINNIIESMDKRIGLVLESNGRRIKY